ncbi:AMP-binding protein [Skermania sp. ID1734]|uniref:(2,3-dihydroxybenzoyl)adenylate synthase n=1 Tax=Skermania sp. ID1734 TaxID=2597516 RepID=UPI00117DF469|nr:AMP-binding protein [Skermania sp. ID1734]TSE01516.1 AMP-binding protein [Skermania sp. ID1734]
MSNWDGRVVPYPTERAAQYRASGAWSNQTTGQRLHGVAARFPDRPAVITADESITYAELDRRTDQLAAALVRLGLQPRDPVIFQLTNRLDTVLAWYATIKAGLVPVATLAAHRDNEIGPISRKVGAVAHFVDPQVPGLLDFARAHAEGHPTIRHLFIAGESLGEDIDAGAARELVECIQSGIDPCDVVAFQLSGGTTGTPKVIPRIHAEYWNNAVMYSRTLGWDEHVRVAHLIPIIHNAGITCGLHAAHSVGACLILATTDAGKAFELMARARATDVLIGHGHYQALLSPAFEPARQHLQRVVLSGAKVTPALFQHVERTAWAGQLFGMSEGMFMVTPLESPATARLTTVGVPVCAEDEIRILEPGTEDTVPDGAVGELCCRGPYTIPGYFDAPEHNRTAFATDGFYRTGDLAAITTVDGVRYVSIEGRIKDLINRGGEKINAEELEVLLLQHPTVANAAVVAMPDPRLGEKTCAYLVSTDGSQLPLSAIQAHLADLGVAKFKWPERLEWVAALPRSNVGKIDKKSLRADVVAKLDAERNATAAKGSEHYATR